jgi:hypothetical protein
MKIEVTDIARTFGRQRRASVYAEYRIFSAWNGSATLPVVLRV